MTRGWLLMLLACGAERSPCALDARPDSIDEVLDTVEQLPSPVTLTCFLESLERPLELMLTSNANSAQGAQGVRSPRIFVRQPHLTLAVVPVGEARNLLELGEDHAVGLTTKAELAFPVELPLDPSVVAFDRILAAPGADFTGCSVCHFDEVEVEGRYASARLRPPDSKIVPLEVLLDEHAACDPVDDPDRCAMMSALLDHGDVTSTDFPADSVALTLE